MIGLVNESRRHLASRAVLAAAVGSHFLNISAWRVMDFIEADFAKNVLHPRKAPMVEHVVFSSFFKDAVVAWTHDIEGGIRLQNRAVRLLQEWPEG